MDESRPESELLVDHWTMRDGLPQNSVLALLEDQDGLIWVATFGGVATFDGLNFEPVDHHAYPALLADRFLSLAQTPDGAVWLGSEYKGVYRLKDGQAQQLGPQGTAWSMAVDPQGQLFVVVDEAVFRVQDEDLQQLPLEHLPLSLGSTAQGVYLNSRGAGPRCLSAECGSLPQADPEWSWSRWTPLPGAWLAVSSHGVFHYQNGQLQRISEDRFFPRRDQVCVPWDQEAWCLWGDEPQRLSELLQADTSPSGTSTYHSAYLQDHEGGLWVGSDGAGLYRYQRRQARGVHLGKGSRGVVVTPWGEAWFLSGGKIHSEQGVVARPLAGVPEDVDHERLFSARDQVYELLAFDAEVHLVLHEEEGSRITQTLPWEGVGTPSVQGPWVLHHQTLYFLTPDHQLLPAGALPRPSSGYILGLRGDESGVWLSERGVGLHRFQDGAIQATYPWTGSVIRDMIEVDGAYWAATYGAGIVRLAQGEASMVLGHHDGMCDEMVSHLFPTAGGELWFNSNGGFGRISMAQARQYFAGERHDVECTLVGSAEGNGSYGAVDSQGRLWGATIQGVAVVDPRESLASLTPRLRISGARYGAQPIQDGDRVKGHSNLSLSFRGLLYSDPKGVRYRYRMVGLDEAWSEETGVQRVDYPKLDPGRYTFEVQARGSGGWGEAERLSFVREPMWFERRLVQLAIPSLALLGLLGAVLFLRRKNSDLREHLRERARAEAELDKQRQENQRIYQELEAGRRLEAIGRLAGGVAHDVNNLLTVVAVHAGILEAHSDPEVRADGQALRDVVKRGSSVTRGLLAFGRDRASSEGTMDVGQEVQVVVPMLRRLIRSTIRLDVHAEPGCIAAIGVGALHQVLSNLILNARDAIDQSGAIQIRVRCTPESVLMEVQDDGVGMSPDAVERAFEPYYTTKALGQGTGLGLSTVQGVIQQHGGSLSIRSTVGEGTCVTVELPLVSAPQTPSSQPSAAAKAALDLDVLVVEDRPEVLKAVQMLVERLGCRAHCALDLTQAMTIIAEQRVDLVLSDVMMPGGSGPEVIAALRGVKPELPALLMSGYTGTHEVQLGDTPLLQKPFSKEELLAAIQALLGRS